MDDLCLHLTNVTTIFKMLTDRIQDGKRYRLVIKEWRDSRTVDQNALNWLWCTEIAEQLTNNTSELISKDDIHDFYKDLFCPVKIKTVLGKQIKIKSTTALETGEMHFYLSQLEYDARSRGLTLTIPRKSEYHQLKERQNQ